MHTIRRFVPILAIATLAASALHAQASLAGPRLFPRGARAPGFQETTFNAVAMSYDFALKSETGADLVRYRLPLQHMYMLDGVIWPG